MPEARFDDLRPDRRRSFALRGSIASIVATRAEDVRPALGSAEQAVLDGRWVAGWVTYEAAAGLGDEFAVRSLPGSPFEDLPLVWFGVFDERTAAERASGTYAIGDWVPTEDATDHGSAVAAVRDHIRRGRTYQVNHTFRLSAPFRGDAATFYDDLAHSQSGGYAGFIDAGRWQVASASPEAFFELDGRDLMTKPMKGTTARGPDPAADVARRAALLASEKDRAENVMIVDMARNDLGRIAEIGSVRVPRLFDAEAYDTVWQLTSTVEGRVRRDLGLADVFAAMFPAASITGAPKLAAMEVIRDLERTPRGVYTGAIGFGGPGRDGRPLWAFNVGIRTVVIDRSSEVAWYGTGGGITFDSDADAEYREARLKTAVLERGSTDFALLETIRWDPDTGFHLLDRHLERLRSSADHFGITVDEGSVTAALEEAVDDAPMRIRLTVDRAGAIAVDVAPLPRAVDRPIRLALDDVPVEPDDPFLRHKTTRRQVYDAARARHPGRDDVVLVNRRGEVTETAIANLAVEIGGTWFTPPVASGCLPGVERARLLDEGTLVERTLSVGDVLGADAVARVNSVRGWEPAELR